MPERFAIYYAPAADDPLWLKAAEWIGRDALRGARLEAPLPGIAREALFARSVSARRYGFHATIKPPMTLAEGRTPEELQAALAAFASTREPVAIGRIRLALLDGFIALVPAVQSDALTAFAGEVVAGFDDFRAPLSASERARRVDGRQFSPRQVELIDRYGYPYVFEQFQLHMTLTDRLPESERDGWMQAAAAHFGSLADAEMTLDRLVLFHEPEAGAPFARLDDFVLTGEAADGRIRA